VTNVEGEQTNALAILENRGIDPTLTGSGVGGAMTIDQIPWFAGQYFFWCLSAKASEKSTD
jgi:hypothetical protein